jgi:hypothetical protein
MTDLAVETGDRVTFPDVLPLMTGGTGLKYLVNEHVAMPPLLVPGAKDRRVVASAPRQGRHPQATRHEPGAGLSSMNHYSPLRERMISLRGGRLLLLAIVVAPLVMAGFVGLTVLLFLPLLGLRRMFRRRPTPAVVRWDGDASRYSGVVNLWDAAKGAHYNDQAIRRQSVVRGGAERSP